MKQRKIIIVLIPLIVIILEALPYGAVLNFAKAPGEGVFRETYSYFSLTPFGYANFGPFITALLSCLLLILTLLFLFFNKGLKVIKVIAVIASLISFSPLLFGISFFSIIGAIISLLLCAETVALLLYKNQKN